MSCGTAPRKLCPRTRSSGNAPLGEADEGAGTGRRLDLHPGSTVFDLRSWRNRDGRDELVVSVPLDWFPRIVRLIDRLGEEPESWPWILEDDPDRQISVAAEVLGIPAAAVADDSDLLTALRIE